MVFNSTFNDISVISWCSVLLVEETGVPGENHQSLTNFIIQYFIEYTMCDHAWAVFKLTMLVVIGTDYTDSFKSNYHTTTTVPSWWDVHNTTLCDKVCEWLVLVSSSNEIDRHNISEILLKVALNTVPLTLKDTVLKLYLKSTTYIVYRNKNTLLPCHL